MEKTELEKHLRNYDFESIFSQPGQVLENLLALKEIKFSEIDPEVFPGFVEKLCSLLEHDSHDIFVAVMHIIFQIKQNFEFVDYQIPQSTISYVIKKICQEKYTQSFLQNVLKFIVDANNLAADGQNCAEEITPLLLRFINTQASFEDDSINHCVVEIISNISAYGFPKSFIDGFENPETLNKVAIIATYNVASYSTDDKTKLLNIILSKLEQKESQNKFLLAAALLLIEEDQSFLFEYFAKLSSEDKAYVLTRLSERQNFFATHESIILHSINSKDGDVLQEADKVMDHLGKNNYKRSISEITNWGEFYTCVLQMIEERQEYYKKDLESYLSSILYVLPRYKEKTLSIADVAELIHLGFVSPVSEYNGVWELEMDDVAENTYEEVERILQEQIADLHRMKEKDLLQPEQESIEAPSGREWMNYNVFPYLQKAISGHEQSSLVQCRWDDVSTILLMGRISE